MVSMEQQENPQNQLTWAHRHLQRVYGHPGSLHGSDLGLLHICYSCVTCCSCETFNSERKGYLWLWCYLLGPIPPTGLHKPALIQEELPPLHTTCYIHGWHLWEICLYPKSNSGAEWMGLERDWEEEKEGKLWLGCKTKQTKEKLGTQMLHKRTLPLCWQLKWLRVITILMAGYQHLQFNWTKPLSKYRQKWLVKPATKFWEFWFNKTKKFTLASWIKEL